MELKFIYDDFFVAKHDIFNYTTELAWHMFKIPNGITMFSW